MEGLAATAEASCDCGAVFHAVESPGSTQLSGSGAQAPAWA